MLRWGHSISMKKEKNKIIRAPFEKAAKIKKEIYRKISTPLHKFAKWFVIIVVSLVFIYCLLCLIAKVLPDPTPPSTTQPTTVETEVADTNTPTTAKKSIIHFFKSLLVLEDFAYTALGAMFGFGASVILENYILRYTKKKAFRNLVDEIIQIVVQLSELRKKKLALISELSIVDLEDDEENLEKNTKKVSDTFRSLKCYKDVVYFPIWESILQNGDLLYFRREDYFNSLIRVYTRLIKIKHMIDDPAVDEKNANELLYYLLQLDMNIKEFLTPDKDFDESLFDAIDGINELEDNYDYKQHFEAKT